MSRPTHWRRAQQAWAERWKGRALVRQRGREPPQAEVLRSKARSAIRTLGVIAPLNDGAAAAATGPRIFASRRLVRRVSRDA